MFDFNALGEMGHLLGEYGEASNINFRRATEGNNLCLVTDIADLPSEEKMEPYTLYLYKNQDGQLVASSKKKSNFIIDDASLPEGMVESIKKSVADISKPPSPEDTKALFKYLLSQKVITKTFRETMLEIGGESGAILATLVNIPLAVTLGSHYTIPLFKDTRVRKNVDTLASYRLSKAGRIIKGWNFLTNSITREITGPILTTALNIPITIIAGRKKTLPYFKDSFLLSKILKPTIEILDNMWGYTKSIMPFLGYIDKVIEYKNQLINSKFTAHVISISFGTLAALGLGAGIAFSAPVSIPLIAISAAGVIIVGAKAEKRRMHYGLYKRYLEDLVFYSAKKQRVLELLRQETPDISKIIGISDSKLKEIPKPKTAMYRTIHSYAERKAGLSVIESSPLLLVKSIEATVNPIGIALEGAATGIRVISSAGERINESYAKYQLKSEIEVLKKIAPVGTIDEDKVQLANQARNARIESDALDMFLGGLKSNKMDLKEFFDKCKVDAERDFNSKNNLSYSEEKLTKPSGIIDNIARKTREYAIHTLNYLFAEKTSYSEYTSFKPETITLLKASGHHSIIKNPSLSHIYDLTPEERNRIFHAISDLNPEKSNRIFHNNSRVKPFMINR